MSRPAGSPQRDRILQLMRDGRFRTILEISELTGDPVPSIRTQLRTLGRTHELIKVPVTSDSRWPQYVLVVES